MAPAATTAFLSAHAEVFNGKTPSSADKRTVGQPVLKIKDVSEDGKFRGEFDSFVDLCFADRYAAKRIREGDILILNAAHNADYVGSKVYRVERQVVGALATGEWLIIRPEASSLDPEYAYYWVIDGSTRYRIRQLVKGIHLYPKDVQRLGIPLPTKSDGTPDIDEQRRIAGILDKADTIRRQRQEAIRLSEEFLRSAKKLKTTPAEGQARAKALFDAVSRLVEAYTVSLQEQENLFNSLVQRAFRGEL